MTGLALICAARRRESQAFVNGAMHWVACRVYDDGFQRFVLAFDLGDEVFREILLPPELPDTCELPFISGSVSVYWNSIAYSYISRHGHDSHYFILWVMK